MPPQDQLPGTEKRSPLQLPNRIGDAAPERSVNIWTLVKSNVHKSHGPHRPTYLGEMSSATALLPYYWDKFPTDLIMYLRREMFDIIMVNVLEHEQIINWCPSTVKLYPLIAAGDGNCLMHAISLSLWGVEDTDLTLRKLLFSVMKGEFAEANEERWRRERNRFDAIIPCSGFRYNTKEWTAEWNIVVNIASPERRADLAVGLPYECLEEFHIFIVANILRRPIIVLAENMWRDAQGHSLQPLNFSGIYLPLGWEGKDCCRYPLVLGYYQMHFTPLVCTMPVPGEDIANKYVVPLVHKDWTELAVHFLTSEEEGRVDHLLREYLYVEEVLHVTEDMESAKTFWAARLATQPPREELDVFDAYMKMAEPRYRIYIEEQHNPGNAKALKAAGIMAARNGQELNDKMAQLNAGSMGDAAFGVPEIPADIAAEEEGYHAASGSPGRGAPVAPVAQPSQTINHDVHGAKPKAYNVPLQNKLPLPKMPSNVERVESLYTEQPILSGIRQPQLTCATVGCRFMRAVSTGKYCTECFKRLRNQKSDDAHVTCLTESCMNMGEQEYNGYCKVCYDQSKFMNDATREITPKPTPYSDVKSSGAMLRRGSYQEQLQVNAEVAHEWPVINDSKALDPGMQRFETATLNTDVINASAVGRKKCITPDCDFTGHPSHSDLCSGCFRRDNESYLETTAETKGQTKGPESSLDKLSAAPLLSSPAPLLGSPVVGRKKCVMPECEFTCNPHKSDMCSGCFNNQSILMQETNKTVAPNVQIDALGSRNQESSASGQELQSPTTFPAERQKQLWHQVQGKTCRTPKCDMFGLQDQNGYCSKCYRMSQGRTSSPRQTGLDETRAQESVVRVPESCAFQPKSRSDLNFTVQKNMCATPGCNGIRLHIDRNDLCVTHFQQTARYTAGKHVPTPPSLAASSAGVSRHSNSSPSGARMQPSAPPPSVFSYQAAPSIQPGTSSSGLHAFKQPFSSRSLPRNSASQGKKCIHWKCSNLALPPDYIACKDCREFVDEFNRHMSASTLHREGKRAVTPEIGSPSPCDDEVPMATTEGGPNHDVLIASKTKTAGVGQETITQPSPGLQNKFKFGHSSRVKCVAVGGCPNKQDGLPSYGNLCSDCFDRDIVRKHHNTMPLEQSARTMQPPRSQSDVIASARGNAASDKRSSRPSNYMKCATPGCERQANPNILTGYCNSCYQVYRNIDSAEKSKHQSKSQQKPQSTKSPSAVWAPTGDKMYRAATHNLGQRCVNSSCNNFGNSQCRGYCNGCFSQLLS